MMSMVYDRCGRGMAWHGSAQQNLARQGWHGQAWLGTTGLGPVRHGRREGVHLGGLPSALDPGEQGLSGLNRPDFGS